MITRNKSIGKKHNTSRRTSFQKQPDSPIWGSEEDCSALVENIADAIYKSCNGIIVWCNDRVEEIFGYTRDEFIGKPASFFLTEDVDIAELTKRIYRETEKRKHCHGTTALRKKDGSTVYIEFSVSRISGKEPPEFITVARDVTKRKLKERERTQAAVNLKEQYFQSLIENSIDVIMILNRDGTIRYESPSIKNFTGYKAEERQGESVFGLIHPDDSPNVATAFSRVINNEVTKINLELRMRHKDGSWRYIEAIGNNLLDDPMIDGIVANFRDITERRMAEEQLIIKENALDNSINAIAMTDMKGTITYINKACLKMWGNHKKEDLLGKPYWELLKTDEINNIKKIAETMLRNQVWRGELVGKSKNGKDICVEVLSGIIKDKQGTPIQTISSFIDMTQRKQAERALRESEEKFRRFVEEMSDGYCVIQGSRIVFANTRIAEMFGYTQKEVIGSSIQELLPQQVIKDLSRMYSKRKRGETLPPQYETTLIRKDGTECPVEFGARLMEYSGKSAVSAVVRDITTRKLMEKALQESETQFRTVFDRTAIGMALIDMNGKPVRINPALKRLLGYSSEELRHMSTAKYIHPDDVMLDAELFTELVTG